MAGVPHRGKRSSNRPSSSAAASQPVLSLPTPSLKPVAAPSRGCCGRMMVSPLRAAVLTVSIVVVLSLYWRSVVPSVAPPSPEVYTFEIVNEYPHDPSAFTQGLLYVDNDTLFESTGLYRESSVRKVHLNSGMVQEIHRMGNSWFGEGLTLLGDRLFQVTWLKKVGFIYDRQSLKNLGSFTHQMTDGWGLTTDGRVLFGSDGTSTLYEIDPENFEAIKKVTVRYKDYDVPNLNELEYINGEVWANVWQTDCIARISPENGKVLSWILLHKLRHNLIASGNNGIDVLNGIAWDKDKKRLFVTGKLWPKLYEIKLHPIDGLSPGQIGNLCRL